MAEIFAASKKGDLSTVQELILNGTSVNVTDKDGRSLLFYACLHNHIDVSQYLMNQGGDVNVQEEKHGWSPLYVTAYKDRLAIAKMLVKFGADVNAKSQPQTSTSESDDSFRSGNSNSSLSDISYETALHAAAKKGHVSMATLLLENGANANSKAELKVTPLHLACFKGDLKIAQVLFKFRADPNLPILDGSTPLLLACQKNDINMVELLLQNGSDVETATQDNTTPLYIASQNGCSDICELLLRQGANAEVKYQNHNDTPITIAAYKNHLKTVQVLVHAGAKLNSTDSTGNTALHLACGQGHRRIVQYLLQKDAELTKNEEGQTVIDIAKEMQDKELVEVLKQYRRSLKLRKYKEACLVEENKNLELLVNNLKSEVRALERHEIPYSTELIKETQHKVKVLEDELQAMKIKAAGHKDLEAQETKVIDDSSGFFHKATGVNEYIIVHFQREVTKDLSERHLLYLSKKIGEDWRTLGRFLKVREQDLEHYSEMGGEEEVYGIWSMLMKWRNQSMGTVTGKRAKLKDSLSQLDRMDVYHMT